MTLLDTIAARRSVKADNLDAPAPDAATLETIVQAATSAPDHGGLKPWRFAVIEGDARERLGAVFAEALKARKPDATEDELAGVRAKPLRAPLIVAVWAEIVENHPKVPPVEQLLCAAMGVENMLLAAQSLGYGAVLLTGPNAYDPVVKAALGLAEKDRMVGFVYLGTAREAPMHKPRADAKALTRVWPGPAARAAE